MAGEREQVYTFFILLLLLSDVLKGTWNVNEGIK